MRLMTRSLLCERFAVALHRAKLELPALALMIDPARARIRELGPNPGDNGMAD